MYRLFCILLFSATGCIAHEAKIQVKRDKAQHASSIAKERSEELPPESTVASASPPSTPPKEKILVVASEYFPSGIVKLKRELRVIFVDDANNELTGFPYNNHKVIRDENFQQDYIGDFNGGYVEVCIRDDGNKLHCTFVDNEGNTLFAKDFRYISELEEGYAFVQVSVWEDQNKEEKWGIIDEDGEYVVPPVYYEISEIHKGFFWAKTTQDLYWEAFRFTDGKVSPVELNHMITNYGAVYEDVCWVSREKEDGSEDRAYFNTVTNRFVSEWLSNAGNFSEGLAHFEKNGKWGFITPKGKVVIRPRFDYVSNFSEGLAHFTKMKNGDFTTWGYINKQGKVVIPRQFDFAMDFKNGYAVVRKTYPGCVEKEGMIDKTGKLVIPTDYFSVEPASEGLVAAADMTRKWGFVDLRGNRIIDFQFDDVKPWPSDVEVSGFSGGVAVVERAGNQFVINTEGRCIIGCDFKITPKEKKVYTPKIAVPKDRLPSGCLQAWEPMSRSNESFGKMVISDSSVQMSKLSFKSSYKIVNVSDEEPRSPMSGGPRRTRYTLELETPIPYENCVSFSHLTLMERTDSELEVWMHTQGAWDNYKNGRTEFFADDVWGVYWNVRKSKRYD